MLFLYEEMVEKPKLENSGELDEDEVWLKDFTFRGIGIHASGIVVSGQNIVELCPIKYIDRLGEYAVALEYTEAEKLGLLKCDILGLAALDKISDTER
jgi:DNA polymerase III alpha subunit